MQTKKNKSYNFAACDARIFETSIAELRWMNMDTKILSDQCYVLVGQRLQISTNTNNTTHACLAVPFSTLITPVEPAFPLHILQSLTPLLCQKAGHED